MLLRNIGLPFLESQDFLFFLVFPMGHEALATGLARSGLGPRRTWLVLQEQVLVLGSTGTTSKRVSVERLKLLYGPSASLRGGGPGLQVCMCRVRLCGVGSQACRCIWAEREWAA